MGPSEASPNSEYIKVTKPTASESPTILEPLKSIVTGLKKTVSLSCVIGGTPIPQVSWFVLNLIFFPNSNFHNIDDNNFDAGSKIVVHLKTKISLMKIALPSIPLKKPRRHHQQHLL